MLLLLLSLCLGLSSAIVKVTWPSYTGPNLDVYSGYVTVDEISGRQLHYVLIRAEVNPVSAPFIVWYQGGPGCSGLFGMFSETGPFRVVEGSTAGTTTLQYNNLGWTKFANMLFIEQPAFVGFSFSNNASDIHTGDSRAAMDNYKFLQLFFSTQFPEYMNNDLWFTGESYGGVYVPMLSELVTSNSSSFLYKSFKGFMIGNPVFSCQGGLIGTTGAYSNEDVNALYWHGLVSYTNYNNWTMQGCMDPTKAVGPACTYIYQLVITQIGLIVQERPPNTWPSLDPDNLFQDFCSGNATLDFINSPFPQHPTNNPCLAEISELIVTYFNRPDVQYALAVRYTQWEVCIPLNYNAEGNSMVNYYQAVLKNKPGVQILVYSGDLDILTVPLGYTMPCLNKISSKIVSAWQPWFVNGVTAGYVEMHDTFTYATIKGAGHEAPLYQPVSSYQMIYRFLTQGNLTEKSQPPSMRQQKPFRSQSDMLRYYGITNS